MVNLTRVLLNKKVCHLLLVKIEAGLYTIVEEGFVQDFRRNIYFSVDGFVSLVFLELVTAPWTFVCPMPILTAFEASVILVESITFARKLR